MKKLLVFCLTAVLMLTMSISSFAAGFVESPSNNPAPELVKGESGNESEDCVAELIITPYSERDELSDSLQDEMEKVYQEVKKSTDIASLSTELKEYCKKNNIDTKNLAISDLFDISYSHCPEHDEHGYFTIHLKADSLKNFVGLLHYTGNGYELVDTKLSADGETLKFKLDDFSPFVIVVDTSVKADSPVTGDNSNLTLWIAILVACVLALFVTLFFLIKRKKA